MNATVLALVLVAANVLGAGMIVPQVIRMKRRKIVDGVSAEWLGVGLGINLWWIAYVVHGALWGILAVSVAAVLLYGMLAYLYVGIVGRGSLAKLAVGVAMISIAPGLGLTLGGWDRAGLALGLSYALQFAPAAVHSVRSNKLDGIAPLTWLMAWCEALVWLLYGSQISDIALIVGGAGGALMASIVLVRVAMIRKESLLEINDIIDTEEWPIGYESDLPELASV